VSIVALLAFAAVVLVAMLLLHSYLWWRMVRSTTLPGRARRRLTWLTVALALLPVLAIATRRILPLEAAAPLDWVAYSWLGIAFYAFLALLALEPVRLALRPGPGVTVSRSRPTTPAPPSRLVRTLVGGCSSPGASRPPRVWRPSA
jgi:hypothetical protein